MNNVPSEIQRLRAAVRALTVAVAVCTTAERARQAKLLPGAPAATYTAARLHALETLLAEVSKLAPLDPPGRKRLRMTPDLVKAIEELRGVLSMQEDELRGVE